MGTTSLECVETPDLRAIKAKQQATWASGDYASVGVTLQIVGERLCEALDVRAGESVLDVAAGNGNASLAAARRHCAVTSTDYVPELLERGRLRAQAEGLPMTFQVADVEDLPFEAGTFDVVTSTFGVMFSPNQQQAAAEMARVCRPGGRIGLANWTPDSFVGEIFKTVGRFVPPPPGLEPPALWGTRERLDALFEGSAHAIQVTPRTFAFRYRSVTDWLDLWRETYGPVHKAFQALDCVAQSGLEKALCELARDANTASDGTMVVHARYIEAVVKTRTETG